MVNSKLPLLYRNINHGYEPYYEVEAFKEAAEKMCFHGRAGRFVTWRNEPTALSVIKKEQDGRAVLIYPKNHVDLRILRRLQLPVQVQLHMQLA